MAQDLMTGSFGQIGMLDLLREDSMDEENMGDRLVVNNSKKKIVFKFNSSCRFKLTLFNGYTIQFKIEKGRSNEQQTHDLIKC